jgi:hypothetical protein
VGGKPQRVAMQRKLHVSLAFHDSLSELDEADSVL